MIIAFSLVVGALLAWTLARRQYRPVAELLSNISSQSVLPSAGNEFSTILSAFQNVNHSRSELDRLWQAQTHMLQHEFLQSALMGTLMGDTRSISRALDIRAEDSEVFLILFSLYGRATDEEADAVLDDALEKCAEAASAACAQAYPLTIGAQRALVVLSVRPDAEALYDRICNKTLEIVEGTSAAYTVLAAASPLTSELNALNICYLDARRQLDVKQQLKRHGMPLPPTLPSAAPRLGDLTGRAFEPVCAAIKCGDMIEAKARIDQLLSGVPAQLEPLQHMLLTRLQSDILALLPPSAVKDAALLRQIDQLCADIRRASTVQQASDCLVKAAEVVCAARTVEQSASLLQEIIHCVDSHLTEPDFNVSKVAQILDMNLSYISQYFYEQNGIGLLEYINRVRVNRAKKLMYECEGDITVSEVAQQVG